MAPRGTASLVGCALLATAARGQSISAVSANRGSLEGGTYTTIWGDGFNRNGQDGSTRV